MCSAQKQKLVVYEAYDKQKHQYGEKHYHPRSLALLSEHAQLENTTKEEFVNEVFAYEYAQSCGE